MDDGEVRVAGRAEGAVVVVQVNSLRTDLMGDDRAIEGREQLFDATFGRKAQAAAAHFLLGGTEGFLFVEGKVLDFGVGRIVRDDWRTRTTHHFFVKKKKKKKEYIFKQREKTLMIYDEM